MKEREITNEHSERSNKMRAMLAEIIKHGRFARDIDFQSDIFETLR